jgi:hypothetical protein
VFSFGQHQRSELYTLSRMSTTPESIQAPARPEPERDLPHFHQGLSASSPQVAAILKEMDIVSKPSIAALDFVDRAHLVLEVRLWCESFAAFHIQHMHRAGVRDLE